MGLPFSGPFGAAAESEKNDNQAIYARRKKIVEPQFGQIKQGDRLRD